MAKNLNMQLTVTADASQAKREMNSLLQSLNKLNTGLDFGKGFGTGFTKDMQKAKAQIAELQVALKSATNMDTGKLDFTKFNQQIKMSGATLKDYAKTLNQLGPEGQQAFMQLAKSISQSEIPLRRVSNTMKEMGVTLANTIRWQISSSVLHGFMGAIQTAYGYAQDLNKSLNNIRIVTGQSTEEMAQFASYANQAAQKLSISTTDVTNAALIYYQQGLDAEQVKERAEVTLKLANVSRQSAEEVSSQMTAIWNNFYDGSESLESYADKITALGAATASSSDEIAQGLEKFAAVADSVGLSYDYATSALATVVAQTRQSADVVGTAFKTLFARLESLKLEGNFTDEEGNTVSLNKYSKALEQVGVNIFQANGQLKDMDEILDDLGGRWQELDRNTKVALAQTVGGMRQYNQLIALMDNYEDFQKNLGITQGAEGKLQEQQDIYAEGWEASTKRVKAAWEDLYDTFIKDDFFIELNNSLADILKTLNLFIDNMGGVKGILLTVSPLLVSMFGDKLQQSITNTISNIKMMLPGVREAMELEKQRTVQQGLNTAKSLYGPDSIEYKQFDTMIGYQETLNKYNKDLTFEQKEQLKIMQEQALKGYELQKQRQEDISKLEKQNEVLKRNTNELVSQQNFYIPSREQDVKDILNPYVGRVAVSNILTQLPEPGENGEGNWQLMGARVEQAAQFATKNQSLYNFDDSQVNSLQKLAKEFDELNKDAELLDKAIRDSTISEEESKKATNDLKERRRDLVTAYNQQSGQAEQNLFQSQNDTLAKLQTEIEDDITAEVDDLRKEALTQLKRTFEGQTQTNEEGKQRINKGFFGSFSQYNSQAAAAKVRINDFINSLPETTNDEINIKENYKQALKEATDKIKKAQDMEDKMAAAAQERAEQLEESAAKQGENIAQAHGMQAENVVAGRVLSQQDIDATAANMAAATANTQALGNVITGTAQAFTGLGSAVNQAISIQRAWDQVAKGNMTVGQAMLQTITSIGFIIPSLTNGIKGAQKVLVGLSNLQKVNIVTTIKNAAAAKLLAVSEVEVTAASIAAEAATMSFGQALKYLALSAGKAIIPIVAIAAVVGTIAYVANEINKIKEESTQALEHATELEETVEQNNALLAQIDALEKLKAAQDGATESKQAYHDELLKVAEALKIENAAILAQAGAYDQLEYQIDKKKKELAEENKQLNIEESQSVRYGMSSAGAASLQQNDKGVTGIGTKHNDGILKWGTNLLTNQNYSLNDKESNFLKDLKALNLSGVEVNEKDFSYNLSEMDDQTLAKFSKFIAEAQKNTDRYGTAEDNDLLESLQDVGIDFNDVQKKMDKIIANQGKQIATESFQNNKNSIQAKINAAEANGGFKVTDFKEIENAVYDNWVKHWGNDVPAEELQSEFINQMSQILNPDQLKTMQQSVAITSAFSNKYAYAQNGSKTKSGEEEAERREKVFQDQLSALGFDKDSEQTQKIVNTLKNDSELFFATYEATGRNLSRTLTILQADTEKLELEELSGKITSFVNAINSLKIGDVLDKEKFDKLKAQFEALGIDINQFTKECADGTYVITKSTEEMRRAMVDSTKENIKDVFEAGQGKNLSESKAELDKLLGESDITAVEQLTAGKTAEQISQMAEEANKLELRSNQSDLLDYNPTKGTTAESAYNDLIEQLKPSLVKMLGKKVEDITAEEVSKFYNIEHHAYGEDSGRYVYSANEEAINKYRKTLEGGGDYSDLAPLLEYQQMLESLESGKGLEEALKNIVPDTSTLTLDELEEIYRSLPEEIKENVDMNEQLETAVYASAKALGIDTEELKNNADYLEKNNDYLKGNKEASLDVALAYARLSKGIQDLNSNFDNYEKSLDPALEGTTEYTNALENINKDLQNVFSTNEDIDTSFILNNLDLIKKASTGDAEAIRDLGNAYFAFENQALNESQAFKDKMHMDFDEAMAKMDELDNEFTFGMTLDNSEFMKQLLDAMVAAGYTSVQINKALEKSGWSGELRFAEVDDFDANGNKIGSHKQLVGLDSVHYTRNKVTTSKTTKSSGSGKSRSKKDKKELKDEKERYYVISRQLQDQLDILNKLDKAKSRAWGKAKLDYIDRETEALEKELDIQKQYLKEIEDYHKLDQKNLNFFGAEYDENGVVTNYDEMIEKELKRYNDAVKKYNAGGSEKEFNKATQRYEDFKKKLKQYDDTNELYQKKLEEIQQLEYEIYDKALEKITTKVEMDIQVNDAELKKLEYDLDRIQKKAFATAEAIGKMGEQLSENLESQASYQEAVNQILANHGIASINDISNLSDDTIANLGFTEDEVNTLLDYNSSLLDTQKTIDELQESIIHGMVDAFEEWNKEFDYQQDKIASNIDLLKQYQTIADLIYSNSPGVTNQFITDVMNSQYAQMVNGVEAAYARLTSQRASLEQAKAEYERLIASGASEQTLTAFRNDLREMESEVEKSQSDMLKKTEEGLKQAEDIFKKAVEDMSNNFKEMVKTSDWDMTKFDRLKKLDEQYLDDYEKIYEFSKLTRDINNSIDDADTIRQKERLREITQEIADIEASGKEVSQFEVDALRKKYELRLAEIALEDAQAAKQTVRMSRDNDGNWSYVYTADEDNVDKARQNYEDKLYEYQKLNSDFIKEQQENFLNLENQYVEEITKIVQDSSLNKEDKERRLQETQEYYQRMVEIMSDQLGIAIDKNSELYNKDWLDYSKTTGYKISKLEDYQTKIEDTYTGVLQPNVESASDLLKQFTEATVGEGGYFPSIMNALGDFELKQEEVLNAAGTTLADYAGLVSGAMKTAEQSSKDAAESVEEAANDMRRAFDEVINKINDVNNQKLDKLRKDIENTITEINKLIDAYKKLSQAQSSSNNVPNTSSVTGAKYSSNAVKDGGGGGADIGTKALEVLSPSEKKKTYSYKDAIDWYIYKYNDRKSSSGSQIWSKIGGVDKFGIKDGQENSIRNYFNPYVPSNVFEATVKKAKDYLRKLLQGYGAKVSFDTGGYTGSWGSEGRLAMLHQKELVLNAHDTENMLNTIQMVRDIVASIDVRAAAAGAVNINNAYASAATAGPQDLNQNVHIEANFPNATDHNEIELALTNLVNRASQYVGRKNL